MALRCVEVPKRIYIEPSLDLHAHLRNSFADGDGRMEILVPYAAAAHDTIVHIGNGKPAIIDQQTANQELVKAKSCLQPGQNLNIFAAPLLRDDTDLSLVRETRLRQPRNVLFWKAFLSGVSNDGGNSVSKFRELEYVINEFYDPSIDAPIMPLHIHAERKFDRKGRLIRTRDREWYAIKTDVQELLDDHPDLTVVIKHVSDFRTLDRIRKWRERGLKVYAEICPHYLFCCHEDLYEGPGGGTAFNAHLLCWPIYKDEVSMLKLREAVLSGEEWIMMGLDWACHNDDPSKSSGVKINNKGIVVGGVAIMPGVAKSLVIDLFIETGSLGAINPYISSNARRVHGLPPVQATDIYDRLDWNVREVITGNGGDGKKITIRQFKGGETMHWQRHVPSEM